jgi:choline monooxygenase
MTFGLLGRTGTVPAIRPLDADPAISPTLPGYLYSDPKVLEAEKSRLFYKSWMLVGHRSELNAPGDYLTGRIVDQNFFLIKGEDGAVRAFFNVCQHRAHQLLAGQGNTRTAIVCPYHAWIYDIDGSLRTARATSRMPEFDPVAYGLKSVRLEERLGFYFVNLDPDAHPIDESLGTMFADMQATMPWIEELVVAPEGRSRFQNYELKANWKVLAENCLECYHCGPSHGAFVDLVDIGTYVCTIHGDWLKSASSVLNLRNKAYDVPEDAPVKTNDYWHMFPCGEFGLLPGNRSLNAFVFQPSGPETTVFLNLMLVMPGEAVDQKRLAYLRDVLWPEDEAICMSVHEGLKSLGYSQGRFVIDPRQPGLSENAVHGFQRRYAEAMGL